MKTYDWMESLRKERQRWTAGPHDWKATRGGVTVRAHVLDFDKFGYLVHELEVCGARPLTESGARAFADRVTYLTEALRVVEWSDAHGGLLRSQPDEMEASEAEYFELTLRPPAAVTMRRYASRRRLRTDFHLTERQCARLLHDLEQLVGAAAQDESLRPV